jgi:hypothetical protein
MKMYEQNSVYYAPVPGKNSHIQPPYYDRIVPPKPEVIQDDDSDSLTFVIKRRKKEGPANKKRPWDTPNIIQVLEETLN